MIFISNFAIINSFYVLYSLNLRSDLVEFEDKILFAIEIGHVDRKDIEIVIEGNNCLRLLFKKPFYFAADGTKITEVGITDDDVFIHKERQTGSVERFFQIPISADIDNPLPIRYIDGVLYITFKKNKGIQDKETGRKLLVE